MAKIALFVGSVREGRRGIKVARWAEKKLKERGHEVFFLDPEELKFPVLVNRVGLMENPTKRMKEVQKQITEADGYLAVTPEYNHSTSGALKNLLDHFLEEYYFRPSAVISYSNGPFGGIRAAEHLRQIFAELGAPTIPTSVPVSRVGEVFDEKGNLKDEAYDRRIGKMLDEFEWYIEAFKNQRAKGTPY